MASAQLGSQSDEVLTDATPPRQLAAISADALTNNDTVPSRQLSAIAADTLTTAATIPQRRLGVVTVEVLVPSRLTFAGWGSPINTPLWF
jgi:hypothetical protein